MAIGTPVQIGTSTASLVCTTSVAVSSVGRLIIFVSSYASGLDITGATDAGPGLTWVIDRDAVGDSNNPNLCVLSAHCPGGSFPSSTAITVTATSPNVPMTSCIFCDGLEVGASGYLSGTPPTPTYNSGGTTWTTPNITTADADALVIGGAIHDGLTPFSSAATTGTEITDLHNAGTTQTMALNYSIESTAGSKNLAGTWTGGTVSEQRKTIVAYKGLAAAGISDEPETLRVVRSVMSRR